MLPEIEPRVEFLKQVHLFKNLDETVLQKIAALIKEVSLQAEEQVFAQGAEGDYFYIIRSGQVRVTRQEGETEQRLARFEARDTFGEEALLFNRPRSASVNTIEPTKLYAFNKENFDWMIDRYPSIQPYLTVYAKSHQLARRFHFGWLGENEAITILHHRHPIRLIVDWFWVALVGFFLVTVTYGLGYAANQLLTLPTLANAFWVLTGLIGLIGLAVGIWIYFDWRNDYFIVTNIRVVWRERILLRSSSRQEAPLRAIQSINAQTQNIIERFLQVGDVTVRTFNSNLKMTDVIQPKQMKETIEEYVLRARRRTKQLELDRIRHTIRQRLHFGEESEVEPQVEVVPQAGELRQVRIHPFKTRLVEGQTITYRKHWSVFLIHSWVPSLLLIVTFIASVVLMIALRQDRELVLLVLGLGALVGFSLGIWWGYHYLDWRNDLYQITKDSIIDREQKPLGKESSRSAPIKNIQSLGHEIPNLVGLILNVGSVHINVGDSTLDFVGVYNPALVHQDISRRMEELIIADENAKAQQEHNRMVTWLEIYHEEAEKDRRPQKRWDFG